MAASLLPPCMNQNSASVARCTFALPAPVVQGGRDHQPADVANPQSGANALLCCQMLSSKDIQTSTAPACGNLAVLAEDRQKLVWTWSAAMIPDFLVASGFNDRNGHK